MRVLPVALLLVAALGGCVQYPDGTWGRPPAQPPAPVYLAPAPPPVVYRPPYAYVDPSPGVPVYVVPAPAPAPSVNLGIGFGWGGWGWGRGYWGPGPGYWGRPYYGRRW